MNQGVPEATARGDKAFPAGRSVEWLYQEAQRTLPWYPGQTLCGDGSFLRCRQRPARVNMHTLTIRTNI